MAKGKKGKGGKKGKAAVEQDPNTLTEVDKTFYELTITDLNRKLARLKTLTTELETKNEELQQNLTKLDEDRNDVIIFLKRTLQEKADEILEFQDRLTALEETRGTETEEFQSKIVEMEEEYRQMHEQLTSEIKLLTGKLNSLEEFRVQRDELMKKFETQENEMGEQEIRHKRELYEIEKKFVIGKDKLKKEMEARLLQLSTEFQDVTEIRIASTTHRVIRENIAINNELDTMLATHQRLYNENEKLKASNKTLKLEASLHEDEKKKALARAAVQYKVIEQLADDHESMTEKVKQYQNIEAEADLNKQEATAIKDYCQILQFNIRILEQNLHASRCERTNLKMELDYTKDEMDRLSGILYEAVVSIKAALSIKYAVKDKALKAAKREALLSSLLTLMTSAKEKPRKPSLESVESVSATYARGDLGFVPKPVVLRSKFPIHRHVEVQMGPSFEELLAQYVPPVTMKDSGSITSEQGSQPEFISEMDTTVTKHVAVAIEETGTVFDESSEGSLASSEEISYHVELPPQEREIKSITETEIAKQIEEEEKLGGEEEKLEGEEEELLLSEQKLDVEEEEKESSPD